jgi:hypothetical protein
VLMTRMTVLRPLVRQGALAWDVHRLERPTDGLIDESIVLGLL